MKIAVIGAGHAGVEAAKSAAEGGAQVTLFGAEEVLPYFRPRLVGLAFGQQALDSMLLHPEPWYAERGIRLCLGAAVSAFDAARRSVTTAAGTEVFDAVVIANGALPFLPPFALAAPGAVFPLWSAADAQRIQGRVKAGARLIIVGGGILGLEAALRARQAQMQVQLVERLPHLMPMQFGPRASAVLLRRLSGMGIGVTTGVTVTRAETGPGGLRLVLDSGAALEADFAIVAIGAKPEPQLGAHAGLNAARGLLVDSQLRTSQPLVFAAGDVIQFEGVTRCAVREAVAQGRIAGANAAAALKGAPLQAYQPQVLPLTFKSGDFELYSVGKAGGVGTEELCLEGCSDTVLRLLVVEGGATVGVQMIGTRKGFDEYAATVPPGLG